MTREPCLCPQCDCPVPVLDSLEDSLCQSCQYGDHWDPRYNLLDYLMIGGWSVLALTLIMVAIYLIR